MNLDMRPAGSRLDSFIRRLQAQRTCLDWATGEIARQPGIVLELGLGNGRTFDHLRHRCGPRRAIFAFDRQLAAHPKSIPDAEHLVLGDFKTTLPEFALTHAHQAVLIHADAGSGDEAANAALARWLAPILPRLAADKALVVCDQMLEDPALVPINVPPEVPPGRYFAFRVTRG